MPTPSAPDPHGPYTFSSTCPDSDESSPSRLPQQHQQQQQEQQEQHEPVHSHVTNNINDSDTVMPSPDHLPPTTTTTTTTAPSDDDLPAQPINITHFGNSDGAIRFAESTSPDGVSYHHKPTDEDDVDGREERTTTHSPYGSSPIEPIQTSRPQQGLGTAVLGEKNGSAAAQIDTENEYAVEEEDYSLPSMGVGFPSRRMIPHSPSSFLRAGSRFTGTQQSERQVYQVQVEIKYVDLRESFLCGFLRIQGLTDDHPTLTTYFEGEIINGAKYGFLTKHADWGANDKTDLSHWAKFPAFGPYSKQARRNNHHNNGTSSALHGVGVVKDVAQSVHIFMRWKEHFLVPDHRVRTITGASFEGFYYICFNQVLGEVNGIYFHSKSERFQQLELKHVEDRGCFSAMEFR
ncbi:unnamed protein product [Discula destructiva]